MAVKKFSLEAIIDLTDRMTKPVQNIEKNMLGFSKKMQKNFGGVGKDIQGVDRAINKAAVGIGIAAVAATGAAVVIGKSFIDAGAEVEKYKTTLTTMLGSVDLANQRFDEMSKFAASTPFELNEVVALGNQLQALGRYSKENMTLLGDLAAASGKPIEQVTGAFAKLVSGQKGEGVNMFRDLLISTKDWTDATGKGIKKSGELMATTEEMIAALPKILGKKGFSGMMDELSKTWEGMSSNFKDTITRFKQGIGTMLLPAAKNLLAVLTRKMGEFSDLSTSKGLAAAAAIGGVMNKFAEWVAKIDIAKVIGQFVEFVKTVKAVFDFLKPLIPIILGLVVAVKLITAAMIVYNAVMWLVSLNPITLIILGIVIAVAALAVGITAMVKHWDVVSAALQKVGGFFVNIGQTIMKYMLMPINLMIDSLGSLLGLIAKLPGMGSKLAPAINALNGFQANMNRTLTGTEGAFDYGGVWKNESYASPSTRTAQSSSNTTTTTRTSVDLKAPPGWGMTPASYGGPPRNTLNFGAAQ